LRALTGTQGDYKLRQNVFPTQSQSSGPHGEPGFDGDIGFDVHHFLPHVLTAAFHESLPYLPGTIFNTVSGETLNPGADFDINLFKENI